jgi:hypothetical protein
MACRRKNTSASSSGLLREQSRWDEQLDADSSKGKLDFLFDEAGSELTQGHLREWPSRE